MPDIKGMSRTSILADKDLLVEAIANSTNCKEILQYLGLRFAGGNYSTLKKYAEQYGLQLPEKSTNLDSIRVRVDDADIFVENSAYANRGNIKKRLYAMGVKEECAKCGIGPEWDGEPLTLQLDHINGVNNDNRIGNLRILCPNCHTQTETYAGRSTDEQKAAAKRKSTLRQAERNGLTGFCIDCDAPITGTAKRCKVCWPSTRYATEYPEVEVLLAELAVSSFVQVAKGVGVSDNALRKHLRKVLGADHPVLAPRKRKQ